MTRYIFGCSPTQLWLWESFLAYNGNYPYLRIMWLWQLLTKNHGCDPKFCWGDVTLPTHPQNHPKKQTDLLPVKKISPGSRKCCPPPGLSLCVHVRPHGCWNRTWRPRWAMAPQASWRTADGVGPRSPRWRGGKVQCWGDFLGRNKDEPRKKNLLLSIILAV